MERSYLIGALTSKPYSFKTRSWELSSIETITFSEASGSKVRLDLRGLEILRILPRQHERLNEDWISDKVRFGFDGLKYQRLDCPLMKVSGNLIPVKWKEVGKFLKKFNEKQFGLRFLEGLVGSYVELESMVSFKAMINSSGSSFFETRVDGSQESNDIMYSYANRLVETFKTVGAVVLVGLNPRYELPILNIKLRRQSIVIWKVERRAIVNVLGFGMNVTYAIQHYGNKAISLLRVVEGRHELSKVVTKQTTNMMIGMGGIQRIDGSWLSRVTNYLSQKQIYRVVVSIIPVTISRVGGLMVGLVNNYVWPVKFHKTLYVVKWLIMIGMDDVSICKKTYDLVVYQGHHGDRLATEANIVLPATSPLEKSGFFLNFEGLVQLMKYVYEAPGEAKIDWKIFNFLSKYLQIEVNFDSYQSLYKRLQTYCPISGSVGVYNLNFVQKIKQELLNMNKFFESRVYQGVVTNFVEDFYLMDTISRASLVMTITKKRLMPTVGYSNYKV